MLALILIVLVGLGIALFAQQNNGTVSLILGPYLVTAVPVYVMVLLSMLFGLFIAWIFSLMDFFSHSLLLRRKNTAIHSAEQHASELEREVVELREENARLRGEVQTEHVDRTEHVEDIRPHRSFFDQLRDRFAVHDREEAIA